MKSVRRIIAVLLVVLGSYLLACACKTVPWLLPSIPASVSDALRKVVEVATGGLYADDEQVKFLLIWVLMLCVTAILVTDGMWIFRQNRRAKWTPADPEDFVVVFESFCKTSVATIKSTLESQKINFYVSHGVLDMADCVADTDAENMVLVPTRIYVPARQKRRVLQIINELQLKDWS